MMALNSALLLALSASPAAAQYKGSSYYDCGCGETAIRLEGSSTVFPVATAWKNAFAHHCPNYKVEVVGGGSSNGARAACGNEGLNADIGDMSREWKSSEMVEVFMMALSNRFPPMTRKPAFGRSGLSAGRMTSSLRVPQPSRLLATLLPLTVRHSPLSIPALSISPITAGTPPA